MKLATSTGDFNAYSENQLDAVRWIQQAGFRYVDYNFGADYRLRNGAYLSEWEDYSRELRRSADALGMKFVQAHSPMGKPIARENGQFVADTIRCVEVCHELGIPNLVVHSGYEAGLSVEETFERNREFYRQLFPAAEQYGVNILVENFNKMCFNGVYWIDNATDLLRLIEYIDHPLFHAVWDAGHGNLQEMPQHEELQILGKHVRALHIQDNRGGEDDHLMPFSGSLNLDSLLHGLKAIDYQGYFTFETGMFASGAGRRVFEADTRLKKAPLGLKLEAEKLLYQIGKYTLDAYGMYEE